MSNALNRKVSIFLSTRWTVLLSLGLVTLLCWQLAYWTWLFLAPAAARPATLATTAPDPARLLDTIHAAHLFGASGHDAGPAMTQATTALDLKLSGVFAATGKLPAVAIINAGNRGDLPFMNGDTILPGVTLEQVRPDHVVLNRGGVMEKLLLEQKGPALALKKTAANLNVRQEGKGRFSISRSGLNQVLSDPDQLANTGRVTPVPGQGMRVEEAGSGSLMSRFGLQSGDMIRQVNGKPVVQAADLLQSYRADGQIRLEGTRNGQPFEYNYTVR
jgi:general secretion pathway protein C